MQDCSYYFFGKKEITEIDRKPNITNPFEWRDQMRILLDTNVLIPLEDSKVLNANIANLTQLANKYQCILLCHPSSDKDIQRDRNQARRELLLSKVKKYVVLEPPGQPDEEFLKVIKQEKLRPNDFIDNELIYAVYRHSVNFLVTEDRGIHKKARRLGIDAKVYTIEQCIDALIGLFEKKSLSLPNIQDIPVYQLQISDPFFISLKQDYPDFENWFKRICEEDRKAWTIFKSNGAIGALLIIKEENNERLIPGPIKKILKVCTFKIDEELRGRKIGELFLKACFGYCVDNRYEATYMTTMAEKNRELVNLCMDFGFIQIPYNEREIALYKAFIPPSQVNDSPLDPLEYHVRHYPFFKYGAGINKFIIPIIPEYHRILFPDCQKQFELFYTNEAVNNGILKAYICNSNNTKITRGDLVLFYRSRDWQSITTLGIVETVLKTDDPNEVAAVVSKRTVYTFEEIKEISRRNALVILFRQIKHVSSPMTYQELHEREIIKNRLESITSISEQSFLDIIR